MCNCNGLIFKKTFPIFPKIPIFTIFPYFNIVALWCTFFARIFGLFNFATAAATQNVSNENFKQPVKHATIAVIFTWWNTTPQFSHIVPIMSKLHKHGYQHNYYSNNNRCNNTTKYFSQDIFYKRLNRKLKLER